MRRFSIVAFITLSGISTLLFSACEDPGFVGGNLLNEEADVVTNSIQPGSIEEVSRSAFTGNLRFMAMGHYNDPLYGEINSVAFLKPAINTSNVSTIGGEDTMQLRLVLDSRVYGDSTSTAEFEIYRVDEFWRGNEIRFGDQISFDESQVVGQFSVAESDTILVDLDKAWVSDYKDFLEMSDSNRDSLYRNNFFGLAIAAVSGSSKILFPRMRPSTEEENSDTEFVRFVVDNEDEEVERRYQTVLDWAMTLERLDTPESQNSDTGSFKVHNYLDSFLEIDLGLTEEKLSSKNLANVELVFYKDRETERNSLPPGHTRPGVNRARIHIINDERISDVIFNRSPGFISEEQTTDHSFRFDITDYANTVLFSTPPSGKLYLSVESINGLLFSTIFHTGEGLEEYKPKILVTSVKQTGN
ncbi:MAG: hypothetical protein WD035_06170 [Balneolaceae bacterium]